MKKNLLILLIQQVSLIQQETNKDRENYKNIKDTLIQNKYEIKGYLLLKIFRLRELMEKIQKFLNILQNNFI